MFRVKINIRALSHDVKLQEAELDARRLGDWADELAKPHPTLTKEDLCQTFKDKLRDGCNRNNKTVA
ncbi:hypothetical protein [Celeribacter neptunius]|uniref:Uncharacterized protein n=1 Tax=Celeribacter neptunius TaxID=588602 RepID=A0A1I3WUY1_9RHOB|nr:hypothetical protein [Celeribacter neptunius]SFK11292.1 hypothetical protein SAMN04487991_3860 [Celeribacter neptunius]